MTPPLGRYCWSDHGAVAFDIWTPDGAQIIATVGLSEEKRLRYMRSKDAERWYSAEQREHEEGELLEGREAALAWARTICKALNRLDGLAEEES